MMKKIYNKNVGVDIGGTKMHMLAVFNDEYIEKTVPTGTGATKAYIKEEIDMFIADLPFEVEGLGIALPGLVKGDDYLISSDVLPSLDDLYSNYFTDGKYIVKFINDVNAATLTEAANNKKADTVAVLMVGTGIALGVYSEGKLFTGANGFAGEVGYAYIPHKDKLERFDNLSSGRLILKKANVSPEELTNKINEGCKQSIKIVKEAGYYFGLLIGLVIQFYNPEVIVVGGSTIKYPYYLDEALKVVPNATLKDSYNAATIKQTEDMKNIVAKWALLYDIKRLKDLI